MSNVLPLKPEFEYLSSGEPVQEIVDVLKELLAQAEVGAIRGFCYGSVDNHEALEVGYCGAYTMLQLAAATRLISRLNKAFEEK